MATSLENQYISSSYDKVIQISGSFLADGTGTTITSLNLTASNAISASYAVSASHEIIKEVSSSYADFAQVAGIATSSLTANTASYVAGANVDGAVANATDALYAQNTITTGKNVSGSPIAKGTPLYFTGSGTQGNLVGIWPADAGNPARMPAGGIAGEAIAAGAEGVVLLDGFISGVDTSLFDSGDEVFVAVGGGYTNVAPTGSSNLIQHLGNVEKSAVNGSGVIQMMGEPRGLPNLQQGYLWVGGAGDVPEAISSSSLSPVTASYAINAATASIATVAETLTPGLKQFNQTIGFVATGSNVVLRTTGSGATVSLGNSIYDFYSVNNGWGMSPAAGSGKDFNIGFYDNYGANLYNNSFTKDTGFTLNLNAATGQGRNKTGFFANYGAGGYQDLFSWQDGTNYTNGVIEFHQPVTLSGGIQGNTTIEGKTTFTGSFGFPIVVDGTMNVRRLHFDKNPFNDDPSAELGAIRLSGDNKKFYTTIYNSDFQISSQSQFVLENDTTSSISAAEMNAAYAGTEAQFRLLNSNGTRTATLHTDTLSVSGSTTFHSPITGSIQSSISASYAATASLLLGSIESASYAATASVLLGSVESASYATVANGLTNGDKTLLSGSLNQSFPALAEGNQKNFVTTNGGEWGNIQKLYQNYDFGVPEYKHAFGSEVYDSFSYNYGTEIVQTGDKILLALRPSGSTFNDRGIFYIDEPSFDPGTVRFYMGDVNGNSSINFNGDVDFTNASGVTGNAFSVEGTITTQRLAFTGNPFDTGSTNYGSFNYQSNGDTLQFANGLFGAPQSQSAIYNTTDADGGFSQVENRATYGGVNANTKLSTYGSYGRFNINTSETVVSQSLQVGTSVDIGTFAELTPQDPLPTGVLGRVAVSGSGLYFHNGTSWTLIS